MSRVEELFKLYNPNLKLKEVDTSELEKGDIFILEQRSSALNSCITMQQVASKKDGSIKSKTIAQFGTHDTVYGTELEMIQVGIPGYSGKLGLNIRGKTPLSERAYKIVL